MSREGSVSTHRLNKQQSGSVAANYTATATHNTAESGRATAAVASEQTTTHTIKKTPLHVTGKSERQTKAGGSLSNECFGAEH